jgi:twitching motility protein PilT
MAIPLTPESTTTGGSVEDLSLTNLLQKLIQLKGSDLHISASSPPRVRLSGRLVPLEMRPLSVGESKAMAYSVLTDVQKHMLEENLEVDFSFGIRGLSRFRGNVFHQRGAVGAVFRAIPWEVASFEALGLPAVIKTLCDKPRGLVLVTGPTDADRHHTHGDADF